MATSIHSILPKLAMALTPLLLGGLLYGGYRWRTRTYDVPANTDIFTLVTGTWTPAGMKRDCDSNTFTIQFTPDRADMIITYSAAMLGTETKRDSTGHYPLLGHTSHSIRVIRPGETALNPDSTPVVWDLTLRNANTFAWHRSDWLSIQFTRDLIRCPDRERLPTQ